MDSWRIFLSHAGEETQAARELALWLREMGVQVWLDVDELKPGDLWSAALEKAIQDANAFAVYVGRSGVQRWVDLELRAALDRNIREPKFRIIPVLGPGADASVLPPFLAQHQWVDLRERRGPEPLRNMLEGLWSSQEQPAPALSDDRCPFVGLDFFDTEDALLFFGRDSEVSELLERLREPFLAVVVDSGSGKSSLVRAGLIPALHRGRFSDRKAWAPSWRAAIARPWDNPFRELANALLDLDPGADTARRMELRQACGQLLKEGSEGLYHGIVSIVPRGARTLLVIDQFEELFTLTSRQEVRRRFIDSLLEAAGTAGDHPVNHFLKLLSVMTLDSGSQ
jgi:hypothetical protein